MQRDWTVCMVIGLVALSVVVIPSKMAGVLQVMQRTNKHQRLYYVPSTWWSKHLVIVGHKDSSKREKKILHTNTVQMFSNK
eukprot:272530-Amphidinium_carterae.1